ncbi:MAG: aminoacyl-tRNA hydrolase [Chloroflexota bacterium]|nr:aminoacyl-tRNA hydrolase [Chloroflexota bacterium]
MADLFLIVGLGNPGARYDNTRHNIGWMALDRLAKRHGLALSKIEHKAQTASGTIGGVKAILAKPMTFMNLSGDSVVPLANFYKITPDRIVILHDDLDIPFGTLRIRKTGSSGGQRGVRHIIERLGTQEIPRMRMGIGRPPGRIDPSDFVMMPFKGDDAITALEVMDRTCDAVELWLKAGMDAAMNRYNPAPDAKDAKEKPSPKKQPEES